MIVTGQIGQAEWAALVRKHGGRIVRELGEDRARFDTRFQKLEYTKEFLAIIQARLTKANKESDLKVKIE